MGPARGLRVVEPAAIGPAPFACMMPADLGADVVRVDRVDGARPFAPRRRVLDRGRRSVALDLRSGPVVGALLRLVERFDVLVEGFGPGVAERLGVGPGPCAARDPGPVHARMTGWWQDGPLSGARGHDINYIALSGALHAVGRAGGPPVGPVNVLGDFAGGGLLLVAGVLVALHERQRSGLGQVVGAAVAGGTAAMLGMLMGMAGAGRWRQERGRTLLDGGALFYGVHACAEGGHVAVGALEERFCRALLTGLGLGGEALGGRDGPAQWPGLRARFAGRFASRTREWWAAAFAGTEACVSAVLTTAEAAAHRHHVAGGTHRRPGGGLLEPAPHRGSPAPRPCSRGLRRSRAAPPGRCRRSAGRHRRRPIC
ncbi:CoA transferase [Streptomyces sp. CO7]